jgi:hypothetical protein
MSTRPSRIASGCYGLASHRELRAFIELPMVHNVRGVGFILRAPA